MNCVVLETAAGPVTIESDGERVCDIRLGKRGRGKPDAASREGARQLREYFAGKRRSFDFPVRVEAPRFTRSVLRRLERIPYGEALSYGEVARSVGNARAARAVGQAVGSNPLPIVVPCHRVLAAGARIGGFGAGLEWKRFLLDLEGIEYRD